MILQSFLIVVPHVCNHGDVRIVGGPNNYTGRPEFCYFGTWRSICGIGFDLYDASVTCSLAGFNHDCKILSYIVSLLVMRIQIFRKNVYYFYNFYQKLASFFVTFSNTC